MNLFYVPPELSIFAVVYGKNVSYLQFFEFYLQFFEFYLQFFEL